MKKIIIILLIPVVVVAALAGYGHYKIKKSADQLAAQMAPFATLSYAKVIMEPDGSVGIGGISITPVGTDLPVVIDKVYVRSSDPLFLLKLDTPLDKGEMPDALSVHLEGLKVDLNSPVVQQYSALMMLGAQQSGPFTTECDQALLSSENVLAKVLGKELKLDITTGYAFSPVNQVMSINSRVVGHQNFDYSIDFDMGVGANQLNRNTLAMLNPQMSGMAMHYKDQGINQRVIGICAQALNMMPKDVIDMQVAKAQESFVMLGVDLGEPLLAAYKQLFEPQVDVQVSVDMQKAASMMMLAGADPQDVMANMDVKLRINNQLIDTSGFSMDAMAMMSDPMQSMPEGSGRMTILDSQAAPSAESSALADNNTGAVSEERQQETPSTASSTASVDSDLVMVVEDPNLTYETKPETPKAEKTYKATPLAQLASYADSDVKVYTQNGRMIEGTLIDVSGKRVLIRQKFSGGVADLPVAVEIVDKVSVYR